MQLAWPEYEAQVAAREGKSLNDDDRGIDMMMAKILSTQRKINRMLDNGDPLNDPDWEKEGMMPIEPIADQYPGITASGYQLTGGASIPPERMDLRQPLHPKAYQQPYHQAALVSRSWRSSKHYRWRPGKICSGK